tara:strand:+ start:1312 stop:1755 length:444 start_codon:yes stop_codon:yes gene_type:complete
MAHFAKINENNIVTKVITISNDVLIDNNGEEQEQLGIDFLNNLYKTDNVIWKKTSYNTYNGKHYYENESGERVESEDQSKAFRKNHAGIGHTYDATRDAFIRPKPYDSWVLNETTCDWDAPISEPSDGKNYKWDESSNSWVEETNIP